MANTSAVWQQATPTTHHPPSVICHLNVRHKNVVTDTLCTSKPLVTTASINVKHKNIITVTLPAFASNTRFNYVGHRHRSL